MARPDDDDDEVAVPKVPVEPRGKDLTVLRANLADTKAKMQEVANEISKMLQTEQLRQAKYRKEK